MEEPPGRLVRARLPHGRRTRGRRRRQDPRAPHQDAGRPRLRRRAGRAVQVPRRAVLDLHRLVRDGAGLRRGGRRLHEQAAGGRRLPVLVPRDRGRALPGARRGHARAQDREGSGDAARGELHPQGGLPLPLASGLGVRQRRLPGRDGQGQGDDRLRRPAPRAGREARARRVDGDRRVQLHRGAGRGSVEGLRHPRHQDVRLGRVARAPHREGDRPLRHQVAGPGPRDHLRADHRRGTGTPRRARAGRGGRHRHRAVRAGHLRQPLDPDRRSRGSDGRTPDPSQGREDRRPPDGGGGGGPRVGAREVLGEGRPRPVRHDPGLRLRRLHEPARGDGAGDGGDELLRPAEPHVPLRDLHLRRGHRPRHGER